MGLTPTSLGIGCASSRVIMKNIPHLILALSFAFAFSGQTASVLLPSAAAAPLGSSTNRGFVVRTVQAPETNIVANSFQRALKQLNGTLLDASGNTITNEALPGPNLDGSYNQDTVNFEKDGSLMDVTDASGAILASFSPSLFPGIPGAGGHVLNFAAEVIGFLELTAGTHTFGISVGAERTDFNDDDGYQLFVGSNPRDFFATPVASYQRAAQGFVGNQHIENEITVDAPVTGIYPFRIVYWQTGGGANLQWYTIDTNTQERILINDPANAAAVKAYRDSSLPAAAAPYVGEVTPNPGSAGNSPATAIEAILFDGARVVDTNSIQLSLNGVNVTPQTKTKTGAKTVIRYAPNATRTDPNNLVRLIFKDSGNIFYTNTWQFSINVTGGSTTSVTGQWDFDQGDLRATVGKPLRYLDPSFDGPTGSSANKTQFGTTAALGIPDLNGKIATVMRVPGDLDRRLGYVMEHGIAPNGGGTRVNQFTLILDVMVASSGAGAASLLQISSTNNAEGDDGDLFWQGNNFGQGGGGYNGTGAFTPGEWHRVIAAYDEAATPPVVTKYVDGIKQDDWTANQGLDNARRALLPFAVLFGDGDHDERREMWVNSIQIRSGKLSDAEMVALGGPGAGGIPQTILANNIAGQWDFNRGDLSATIGKPLRYLDPAFDGPTGSATDKTAFGTTTALGVADINGQPADVIRVPGDLDRRLGYVMEHGIKPNGGGTRVNQYTLIMDVMIGPTGAGAASLLQISSTNNAEGDDGDLFWQGNNFGQGGGGYNGTGAFTPGEWHRVIAAYDEAASPPVVTKFVDGIKQDDWTANQGLDNARRALLPFAVLFGDGDHDERREMWVNSIQIRPGKISDAEAVILGRASAAGIPVYTSPGNVSGQWDFDRGDLSATIGKPLRYLDPTFDGPTGSATDKTAFGTTTALGVTDINGQPATIVRLPGDLDRRLGYVMEHGIKPNGGGTRVNQYTLIMDVMIAPSGAGAASLLQISSTNNAEGDDGDLFWQGNNFGQGGGGYNGTGAFTPGNWHRVIAAYDEAATPPVVTKYVDGIFQDDWTANQALDNPRRALLPTAVLFGDGDHDERREVWVNSIQIRSSVLSKAEMEALGGPSAAGIPVLITPAPKLNIFLNGTIVTIVWDPSLTGFALEAKGALTPGTWSAVSGVTNNCVTVQLGTANQFYRLRK